MTDLAPDIVELVACPKLPEPCGRLREMPFRHDAWTPDEIATVERMFCDDAAIDDIVVRQRSGAFVEHAWDVLRTVEPGRPVTYTEYADLSGRPAAVRAAAMACARNAAALFVPCHRVLRLDGSLGGFRWGLAVKEWLLTHEAHTIAT